MDALVVCPEFCKDAKPTKQTTPNTPFIFSKRFFYSLKRINQYDALQTVEIYLFDKLNPFPRGRGNRTLQFHFNLLYKFKYKTFSTS